MADARFYESRGPFTLGTLVAHVGAVLQDGADPALQIRDVVALSALGEGLLSFATSDKIAAQVTADHGGCVVTTAAIAERRMFGLATVRHENPAAAFAKIATLFYPSAGRDLDFDESARIHPSARLGDGVVVETGAVIGADVEIGDRTRISANAVIGRGVRIGRDSYVGPCASVAYALVGDRVLVFAGARIGCDGFGYTPDASGLVKVPQLGRVILQDDVEVGGNSVIDRGALDDTIIGEGTKIDNLVQIAHNCVIGRYAVIAAQVGLAGSVRLEDGAVLGGQVGVGDHLTVGAGAQLAAKTGVAKSLPGGQIYGGTPARPIMQWRRESAALSRLVKGRHVKRDE